MLIDGDRLGQHLMQLTAPCRRCGASIQFEEGALMAMDQGIQGHAVMCKKCGTAFTVHLNPRGMTLLDDVTAKHPATASVAIQTDTATTGQPQAMSRVAVFARRAAAYVVDWAILSVPTAVLIATSAPRSGPPTGGFALVGFALALVYAAGFESSAWQATPGKRLMRLKVSDVSGQRIGFGRAALRAVGRLLSLFLLGAGFLVALISARRQALHDVIAGTLVEIEVTQSSLTGRGR